jgi:hypothetical protein
LPAKKQTGRGGARVGAGRKPKPAAEKQRNPVQVNFTDAEHRDLEEVAGTELLASYIRRLVLRHLARRKK